MLQLMLKLAISTLILLISTHQVKSVTCLSLEVVFGPAAIPICEAACGSPLPNGTCFFDAEISVEEFFEDAECLIPCGGNPGAPECGNGIVETGEECDDGNTNSGDGCSNVCENEGPPPPVCGNDLLEAGEECDDGNIIDGDGCSSTCEIEAPPVECEDLQIILGGAALNACLAQCDTLPEGTCFFDPTLSTEVLYKDSVCTIECTGPGPPVCGNGIVEQGEQCDDGNNNGGDGCNPVCINEGPPPPVCGNGILEAGEQCDDGNNVSGDGCSSTCTNEVPGECLPLSDVFGPASIPICQEACQQDLCFFDPTVSNEVLFKNDGCTLTCDEPTNPPEDVIPILECVRDNNDGTFSAFFGYNNPNDFDVTLAIGNDNKFVPAPEDRGQPTLFEPGQTPSFPNAEFSVVFDGSDLTWMLDDGSVTANQNSTACPICTTTTTLNFETLLAGTIVDDEFINSGVLISADNNFSGHPDLAITFDSANPTGGDDDLGTPNEAFGGPGIGSGGTTTNDTALGQLLIIAENDNDNNGDGRVDVPDDEALGGTIRFLFNQRAAIQSIDMIDIDDNSTELEFEDINNNEFLEIDVPNLGSNSVQTMDISQAQFTTKRLKVDLAGSGAVDNLVFCNDPTAPAPACGDGEVNFGEECDDGNLNNGDGCSSTCLLEDDDSSSGSDDDSSSGSDDDSSGSGSDDDSSSVDLFSNGPGSELSALKLCSGTNETLYGVLNRNDTKSILFKYDLNKRRTKQIGKAVKEIDIEAMDIHPLSGNIYAITGNKEDVNSKKRLLTLDRKTGIPSLDTGVQLDIGEGQEFEGASFHPITNELWAIGKGVGLRIINIKTGASVVQADIMNNVECLAWDDEGENLYFYLERSIARFNQASGKTEKICDIDLANLVEAMEFNNNGDLTITTKEGGKHKTRIVDLATCEVVSSRAYKNMPKNRGRIESVTFGCE